MNNTLETAARDYAGIKPDVFIDSEERYYNSHACENYDTFKAGANWILFLNGWKRIWIHERLL